MIRATTLFAVVAVLVAPSLASAEYVSRNVGQVLRGNQTVHLRQLLNLGQHYEGRRIEQVIVRGYSRYTGTYATIRVNDRAIGTRAVGYASQYYQFDLDPSRNRLGQDVQGLHLLASGEMYLESVGVFLDNVGPDPAPGTVTRSIGRWYRGLVFFDVRQALQLGTRYEGRRVLGVTLHGHSINGWGDVTLRVNGMNQGWSQRLSPQPTVAEFRPSAFDDRLGQNGIWGLGLELDGEIYVDRISVRFDR